MIKRLIIYTILASAIGLTANQAMAAGDTVYGYQLMTAQERVEYREKMRNMKTAKEREAFRLEHHTLMQERAREKGVTLPDEPAQGGKGAKDDMSPGNGNGAGSGNGTGSGGGMGQKR